MSFPATSTRRPLNTFMFTTAMRGFRSGTFPNPVLVVSTPVGVSVVSLVIIPLGLLRTLVRSVRSTWSMVSLERSLVILFSYWPTNSALCSGSALWLGGGSRNFLAAKMPARVPVMAVMVGLMASCRRIVVGLAKVMNVFCWAAPKPVSVVMLLLNPSTLSNGSIVIRVLRACEGLIAGCVRSSSYILKAVPGVRVCPLYFPSVAWVALASLASVVILILGFWKLISYASVSLAIFMGGFWKYGNGVCLCTALLSWKGAFMVSPAILNSRAVATGPIWATLSPVCW